MVDQTESMESASALGVVVGSKGTTIWVPGAVSTGSGTFMLPGRK